ncbi:phage tail protein [Sphingomonas sp. NPDC092331]|jgi:phage tail-like protein|uniref:Phage tail-like protein n=1 Tax=Sphingomonas leidyi TaxID=68569 RepID=A0A7X5ZWN6_9SPHN|nr:MULTISPECIES: phage tail protein [Sphingomonas]MCH7862572.1 phage tail protein [Pseudomonadota bacterium]MDF2385712.1 phage tail protein [Nostoc ellipsosporum NOK]MBN8811116.1 phage tail protein [Sphingomonas sp.]MBQ1496708.1 phage tail protein [Sphingomonas sp.]MDH4744556.1 phage tail protein [Sphingomonas sp. CBMAI 2297]
MPSVSSTSQSPDPYLNFKFRIKWQGKYVAGLSKCSALKRSTEATPFREGGDPSTNRILPGQTKFEPITLERGMTQDLEFETWVSQVWNYRAGQGMESSLANFRRNITLEFYNAAGQLVYAYNIYNCWPSEYTAMPELDSSSNAVAIQTLVLQNEGWERDASVKVPPPPSY